MSKVHIKGQIKHIINEKITGKFDLNEVLKSDLSKLEQKDFWKAPAMEIGVGYVPGEDGNSVTRCPFTSAIQGAFHCQPKLTRYTASILTATGLKDFVTGRRCNGRTGSADGDEGPNDPAYLYWLEAKRDKDGFTSFIPHEIDDDSGIGTTFTIIDINGDGLLDIVISNKKGVFLFIQAREATKD